MSQNISLIVYPVKDLSRAKQLYGKLLGAEPYVDTPYYVGFRIGDQEVGLDPHGHSKGLGGPIGYTRVADIKQSLRALLDAGAQVQQEVQEVGGGALTALLMDADSNVIGLVQR